MQSWPQYREIGKHHFKFVKWTWKDVFNSRPLVICDFCWPLCASHPMRSSVCHTKLTGWALGASSLLSTGCLPTTATFRKGFQIHVTSWRHERGAEETEWQSGAWNTGAMRIPMLQHQHLQQNIFNWQYKDKIYSIATTYKKSTQMSDRYAKHPYHLTLPSSWHIYLKNWVCKQHLRNSYVA